jgi:hypothetical protein
MIKRNFLLCSLLVLVTVFTGSAFAAAATSVPTATPTPYASIVAFNQNNINQSKPEVSTLGVFDIVNMTPWNISIGPGPSGTAMLQGMTTSSQKFTSLWLAGFNNNKAPWNPNTPPAASTGFGGGFAFHSFQIALSNLNNAWSLKNKVSGSKNPNTAGYSETVYYETVPIVFNSSSFTQGNNTVALNFSATSTVGFNAVFFQGMYEDMYPGTTLSFGDGVNSYGWQSFEMVPASTSGKNTTHFLTLQALQGQGAGANSWKPIAAKLGGVQSFAGKDGSAPGTNVLAPNYLNVSGLVYPNFSSVTGDGQNLDLVVIVQAGGYADMQLLFLAVPSSNNGFLQP